MNLLISERGLRKALGSARPVLASALVLALVGCGGGSDSSGSQPVATPSPTPSPTSSGPVWRTLALGAGGFVTGIDLEASLTGGDVRVVRTDTYGGYVWRNNRWEQLVTATSMPVDERVPTGGGTSDVVIAPSRQNVFYMYFNSRFYRSEDQGRNWVRSTAFGESAANANDNYRTGSYKIAVDPANSDIVYVGTRDDGVRRTTDAGSSWTKIGSIPAGKRTFDDQGRLVDAGGGMSIFFDPAGGVTNGRTNVVYASSWQNGIWRSGDGGATWTQISGGGNGPEHAWRSEIARDSTLFVVNGNNGTGGVWRFRGGSWTNISPSGSGIQTVAVDPFAANRVYAFSDGGTPFRSLDGGTTWTRLRTPSVRSATGDVLWHAWTSEDYFSLAQVKFDPSVPGKVWAAQGLGVWTAQLSDTSDTITWQATSRGIEQLVVNEIISPPGGKPVTAVWDRSTFYSESLDAYPATHGPSQLFNSTWDLDWSTSNPKFVVSNTSDHRFCCLDQGNPTKAGWSADGGKTWTTFPSFPQIDSSINPTDPTKVFGDPKAFPNTRFGFGNIAVAADNIDNIIWLPSWNRQPAYTLDRGATWRIIRLPGEVNEQYNSHYANFLNRKVLVSDRVLPGTFYYYNAAGTNITGVWRTRDGGRTWTRMSTGEITSFSVFNATLKSVPGNGGHLFFTPGPLQGNPDIPLKRSKDGGATWTDVLGASRVADFGFGKPKTPGGYPAIFIAGTVGGKYGIYRSDDEGATWVPLGIPNGSLDIVSAVEGDKDIFGRVYVGFSGSGAAYADSR